MRELIYPAIYKHFKNKYYATMGIAEQREVDIAELERGYMKAIHTETADMLTIEKTKDGEYIINDWKNKYKNEKVVLYKSLYDDTSIYARPLDMFLSEVDKEKYPEVKQKYRMELVKY